MSFASLGISSLEKFSQREITASIEAERVLRKVSRVLVLREFFDSHSNRLSSCLMAVSKLEMSLFNLSNSFRKISRLRLTSINSDTSLTLLALLHMKKTMRQG